MTKKQNNATTCNQPNDATKVTPAHYEELEELQLESVAGGNPIAQWIRWFHRWHLLGESVHRWHLG